MANVEKKNFVDPGWPKNAPADSSVVTEMVAPTAGGLSPYGDDTVLPVPAEELSYVHPYTRINR